MLGFILKRFLIDRPPKAALTSPKKKENTDFPFPNHPSIYVTFRTGPRTHTSLPLGPEERAKGEDLNYEGLSAVKTKSIIFLFSQRAWHVECRTLTMSTECLRGAEIH